MPRKEAPDQPQQRKERAEIAGARIAIQTTKLLRRYRRAFGDIVSRFGGDGILAAIDRIRGHSPTAKLPADATKLERELRALSFRHYLPFGPVNPADPVDGLDLSALATLQRAATVTVHDPSISPMEHVLGPGRWTLVWVNADASERRILEGLNLLGLVGTESAKDVWGGTWGIGNGFSYLILIEARVPREEAIRLSFGAAAFREDAFDACIAKTRQAAAGYVRWFRTRLQFTRHEERWFR